MFHAKVLWIPLFDVEHNHDKIILQGKASNLVVWSSIKVYKREVFYNTFLTLQKYIY